MSKVVLDVSMSLDGFVTGPNVREAAPMGDGGQRLHGWMAGEGADGEIDLGRKTGRGNRDPSALPRSEAVTLR